MFKAKIEKLFKRVRLNYLQNKELEWAHVYHDSIRGKKWLQDLPLNVGRWAGSYSLFYILNRILSDYRPLAILETGLGESSKFISTYLDHELVESSLTTVEQSELWQAAFNDRFLLNARANVVICDMVEKDVKGHPSKCYANIEQFSDRKFDLYLIDGPFGSNHYSRYDMVRIARNLEKSDEFIMIIDDYERTGEKESVEDLMEMFEQKQIAIHKTIYEGNASVLVIATEKYKYATSL